MLDSDGKAGLATGPRVNSRLDARAALRFARVMHFPERFIRTSSLAAVCLAFTAFAHAQVALPDAKPVPRMQAVPQPYEQVSFQRDGVEISRLHYGPALNRPFVFPAIGPSGRSVTRIGHPHDPVSHSHHNSIWVSHNDVNGVTFWADRGTNAGRIIGQRCEVLEDGDTSAAAMIVSNWTDKDGKVLLQERRRTAVELLPNNEWLLIVDLLLEPRGKDAVFGKTPFGLFAVRMAKPIGTADGGGTIRNSAGNVNEQGPNGCFWKPAKWCDYSGPNAPGANEGATLLDHPSNPNHPTVFHVRSDGWMGSSLTFDGPRTVPPGRPLQLRYAVFIHSGVPTLDALNQRWETFAGTKPFDFTVKKK